MEERIELIKTMLSVFDSKTDAVEMVGEDLPDTLDYDAVSLRYVERFTRTTLIFDIFVAEEMSSSWTLGININTLHIEWGTLMYQSSDWDIINRAKGVSLKDTLRKIRENNYTLYDLILT